MNDARYVEFFHVINTGTYKLIFIELGCLFDPDNRAASIRSLKDKLEEIGRKDLVEYLNNELSHYGGLVSKILTIRSKLMAHKEFGASSEDVHKSNGITPNEIGDLITTCCKVILEVYERLYGNSSELLCCTTSGRFEEAILQLLDVIRNGRS